MISPIVIYSAELNFDLPGMTDSTTDIVRTFYRHISPIHFNSSRCPQIGYLGGGHLANHYKHCSCSSRILRHAVHSVQMIVLPHSSAALMLSVC